MTLLRNVTAVTLNERREIVDDAAIKIDGNKILSIGKASEYPSSEDELDCSGLHGSALNCISCNCMAQVIKPSSSAWEHEPTCISKFSKISYTIKNKNV